MENIEGLISKAKNNIEKNFKRNVVMSGTVRAFLPKEKPADNFTRMILENTHGELFEVRLADSGGYNYVIDGNIMRTVNHFPFRQGDQIDRIEVNKKNVKPWSSGSKLTDK